MIRSRYRFLLFCLFFSLLLHSPQVFASQVKDAIEHYKKGHNFFFKGNYLDALDHFRTAQKKLPKTKRYQKGHAFLLYYIGISYYKLKNPKRAKDHLQSYLLAPKRKPALVEKARTALVKINNLLLAQEKSKVPTKRRSIRDAGDPSGTKPHIAGWIITGIGGAVLLGGGIAGLMAYSQAQEVEKRYSEQQRFQKLQAREISGPYQEAEQQGFIANMMFLSGGALLLTGTILLFVWKTPGVSKQSRLPSETKRSYVTIHLN